MKTTQLLGIALLAISLGLSGCGEIETPVEPTPDPKPEEIKSEITIDADIITNGLSFTSATGEKSISFTTNEDWTLSIATTQNGDAWCSASTTSGTKGNVNVKFSVTENTSYDDRSVSVTIKSGTASKTFTITQKYAEALLLTTNKYELSQEGGTIEIEVKANIDYEMEIAESAKDWITEATTRALSTYKHSLNIATNEEVEKREGEIYFKSGDEVEIVKVYQSGAGPLILLSSNEYYASSVGETITIDIRSNCEYDIVMPNVDWIKNVPETKAMSSHTLKYEISPNEIHENRDALIIFREIKGSISDTLHIIQGQKDAILLSQKEVEINFTGGTIEVKLESNTDYEIIMPENGWVTECNTRTFTTQTKTFSVSENNNADNRSCHIVFQSVNKSTADTLIINQKGKSDYLFFEEDIAYCSSRGDIEKIKIHSDMAYELSWAEGCPSWIDHWTKDTDGVSIQLNENTSVKNRSTQLFAKSRTLSDTLTIVQQGVNGIELTENSFEIDYIGDTVTFNIYANIDYNMIIPKVDWIKAEIIKQDEITTERTNLTYNSSTVQLIISALGASEGNRMEHIRFDDLHDSGYPQYDQILTIKQYKKFGNSYTMEEVYRLANISELEELSIEGEISRTDFNFLRKLAGGDIFYYAPNWTYYSPLYNSRKSGSGKLKKLDLSKATIVKNTIPSSSSVENQDDINWQTENTIDYYHFSSTMLETIVLPENLENINNNAFENCAELTNIILGGNIETIHYSSFNGCAKLKQITFPATVHVDFPEGGYYFLNGCCALTDLVFLGDFYWPKDADFNYYHPGLFRETQLTNLTIHGKTKHLPPYIFYGCEYLQDELVFNDTETLGERAFAWCSNVSKFTFNNSRFTTIGVAAFTGCKTMISFDVPTSVTRIEDNAFEYCFALETIIIPESVNYIGRGVFSSCNSLHTINCYSPIPPEIASTKYGDNITLYIPKGSLAAYEKSQWGLSFNNIVEME